MNVLLLSTGGGGGNIVRSVKALFQRDLAVTERTDPEYAERLRGSLTTCCLDTNEFSLAGLPPEERLLIGARTAGGLGARHNPEVARAALEESRSEVEALIARHAVIIIVGTGGKGTGAGTIFPLAQIAREQKKLVIPIFVRPSFERHEVDKRRYDHALAVNQQFDAAKIRFVEVLNDRGYSETEPKPQSVVWEQMNLPIARGLRGLIYVLWDLSQVDPSDLSTLFAGHGRLRLGYGEINPPADEDPTSAQVDEAVRTCWDNPYYMFSRPAGTSLICIQGGWSNVVDARIKGGLAVLAMGGAANSPYVPLFARAANSPRPWGVTALVAEHSGEHEPLDIAWPFTTGFVPQVASALAVDAEPAATLTPAVAAAPESERVDAGSVEPGRADSGRGESAAEPRPAPAFASLWEFAVAVNRSDPAALALARNGAMAEFPIGGAEVRKLAGTVWFRGVVPKLSAEWRTRLLDALAEDVEIPNHPVRTGRRSVHLSDLDYRELEELSRTSVLTGLKGDFDFLLTIGRLFGSDAIGRLRFADVAPEPERSTLVDLVPGLRRG